MYSTNADYDRSKSAFFERDPDLIFLDNEIQHPYATWKEADGYPGGRATISIKNKNFSGVVFFKEKKLLQITYHSIKELEEILYKFSNKLDEEFPAILITEDGSELFIKLDRQLDQSGALVQYREIQEEIQRLQSYKYDLHKPSPYGTVWRKDENGVYVHPFEDSIKNTIQKLSKEASKILPYCECPFKDNVFCEKKCNPKKGSLRTNFIRNNIIDCHLYDENDLQILADYMGAGVVFKYLSTQLGLLIPYINETDKQISFIKKTNDKRKIKPIIDLLLAESDPEKGLKWHVYEARFIEYFKISKSNLLEVLPDRRESWVYGSTSTQWRNKKKGIYERWTGYTGYMKLEEAKKFIKNLRDYQNTNHV
jgi:hypothetical protein